MRVLEIIRQRRLKAWARVAGSTYAEWLVDLEFALARDAAIMFAVSAPLAVVGLFMSGSGMMAALWIWPLGVLCLIVLWVALSRRHGNLPLRIADDLWMRGFAVFGLPPVYRDRDFLRWVQRNHATPADLDGAATSSVVREVPTRTAGPRPLSAKLALAAGALGVVLLTISTLWQFSLFMATVTPPPGETPFVLAPRERAALYLVVPIVFCVSVESLFLYLGATGSRLARKVATWQMPLLAVGFAIAIATAPDRAWLDPLGGAAIASSVALLWTASTSRYIAATDGVNRVIAVAVSERIKAVREGVLPGRLT